MLNGVGGRTIAEAKENMTHKEALQWADYISKTGSLNTGRRIDRGFAMLTTWLLRVNGSKAEIEDFLPYHEKQPDKIATPDEVLNLFKAISKHNNHLTGKR